MNNRNKIFNHEELEEEMEKSRVKKEPWHYKPSKHTLDSDEEDEKEEAKKYNVLDPNDLEGQEEKTIERDGDIQITPFNMKEELEEGYFDKEGTYIFQKESDVIKDQWLDDIDWVKVKAIENTKRKTDEDSDSEDERPPIDLVFHYKQMLELMKPKETVQRAICRLGGSTASRSASNRWKKKKEAGAETSSTNEEDVEKLAKLTSLADNIIHSGDMDIYQQTYEKMSFFVDSKSKSAEQSSSTKADPDLDMFGDEFEETVDENKASVPPPRTPSPSAADSYDVDSEVMWEFKWEPTESAKVYGPFPTSQMYQWVEEKYFDDGVLVRQVGRQDAEFHSSKRVDFELYM